MFNRIQPPRTKEEWIERNGSSYTAWTCIFFWLMGGVTLLKASVALYYMNPAQDHRISILSVILAFVVAILFLIGAREIGRFNRRGVTFIAVGFFVMVAGWFNATPSLNDLILDLLAVIALVIAWYDLAPEGHGSA